MQSSRTVSALALLIILTSWSGLIAEPDAATFRATDCTIHARHGHYAVVESERGRLIRLAADHDGSHAFAIGDFSFRLPKNIPSGRYRVTVRWRTGTMNGTPWGFRFVVGDPDNGPPQPCHYFYPGLSARVDDQWFAHDLAGPEPLNFDVWPNSPIADSMTVKDEGPVTIRIRDMSPARNNSLSIESFVLSELKSTDQDEKPAAAREAVQTIETLPPVGEEFTIGVYYAMPWLNPKDNFSWDYAFMDMARSGCNFVVISGNCWSDQWAAIKHWDMRAVTSYGQLNAYPGPGKWKSADFLPGIQETRQRLAEAVWKNERVGDAWVGHIMTDEPECHGLTEDQKQFLRAWADVFHEHNPKRRVYVNHCDPEWYDLNEKHATCSAAPTIAVNSHRIAMRQEAARAIGLKNFTYVALMGRIRDWSAGESRHVEYWNMGRGSPELFKWLELRTNAQDAYEMMTTAYFCGCDGFHPYMYNQHRAVSLVDKNGHGQYGIRAGFRRAAYDIRRSQGWPSVTLTNNGSHFSDRGTYAAGEFQLFAKATSDHSRVAKVVFGKTTNGGSDWETIEDTSRPYSAKFIVKPSETVIFRARAVDSDGRKSLYAANMISIAAE